jgi:hypothetical protein
METGQPDPAYELPALIDPVPANFVSPEHLFYVCPVYPCAATEPEVVPADALAEAPGQRAELCVGGPAVNRRSGAHLARYLPGVGIRPFDPGRRDSVALVVGGQRFLRDPEEAVYAVLARFLPAPGARPVFVIAGQNGIANRGAASYLARNDRALGRLADGAGRFCLIVKVPAPRAYGHGLAELASDVTAAAFAS